MSKIVRQLDMRGSLLFLIRQNFLPPSAHKTDNTDNTVYQTDIISVMCIQTLYVVVLIEQNAIVFKNDILPSIKIIKSMLKYTLFLSKPCNQIAQNYQHQVSSMPIYVHVRDINYTYKNYTQINTFMEQTNAIYFHIK